MLGETVDGLLWWLLSVFLVYRVGKALAVVYRCFYKFYLTKKFGWRVDLKKYAKSWAVVTGCTDGIGKAYTLQLAKRGIRKFLLIGRNPSKLDSVTKSLKSLGATDVERHVFDFATDDWDKLPTDQLKAYKIGILVNCAGLAVDDVTRWSDHPEGLAASILRINATAAVQLIDLVLRNMVKADDGMIINVASIQGWRPIPNLLTYSGSKACLTFISEALKAEYSNTNVKIQCLVPIMVATKMTYMDASEADGYIVMDADEYARQAVDIIGVPGVCTGCVQHDIQATALTFVPFWLSRWLLTPIYKYHGNRIREARHQAHVTQPNHQEHQ